MTAALADLMQPPPARWGLRGDPKVWAAMSRVFDGMPLPASEAALRECFGTAFETLAGVPLADAPENCPVAWTAQDNGGMSNGLISGRFWRETALPLLIARYDALRA